MARLLASLLICGLCLLPVGAAAQTDAPQRPAQQAAVPDFSNLDLRRALLATAGAFLGVSLINTLSANPATAEWMVWLSRRALVLIGAWTGSRLFGGSYDAWMELTKQTAPAPAAGRRGEDA